MKRRVYETLQREQNGGLELAWSRGKLITLLTLQRSSFRKKRIFIIVTNVPFIPPIPSVRRLLAPVPRLAPTDGHRQTDRQTDRQTRGTSAVSACAPRVNYCNPRYTHTHTHTHTQCAVRPHPGMGQKINAPKSPDYASIIDAKTV